MTAEAISSAEDGEPERDRRDGPTVPGGVPEPGPGGAGEPAGIQWIDGSEDVGSPRDGMRWSWELDLGELLSAAGLVQAGAPGELADVDQEASLAAEQELIEAAGGRERGRDLTGRLAEHLPAGPGLAAWLAAGPAGEWSDWDLPGVAAAFRRVASWAQAGELAAVAAIASRTAERDPKVGTGEDGCPAGLAPSAVAEVSLALSMSHVGASWWAGLGVALQWRLAATGRALAAGEIDVSRARLVSEATAVLSDELAQKVEARVLPDAGQQTTGQLRAALRRAVIAVDPRGADDRRRDAELQADVRLYADGAGTATIAATGLPSVHSAAMMARLTALARGLRAGGAGGRLGLLRAYALTGLVLGTMPLIPAPGPEAPTDPGPDDPPDPGRGGGPPDTRPGGGLPDPGPGAGPPEPSPGAGPRYSGRGAPPDVPGSGPPRPPGPPGPPGGGRRSPRPSPQPGPARPDPARDGPDPSGPAEEAGNRDGPADPDKSWRDRSDPDGPVPCGPAQRPTGPQERAGPVDPADPDESWRDVPPPGDADMPPPRGEPAEDRWVAPEVDPYDIDRLAEDPAPAWPPLPATVTQIPPLYGGPHSGIAPPGSWPLAPPGHAPTGGRPPPGRLDLTISWPALIGQSDTAATLSRIGPITTSQALPLAVTAAADLHAAWRVIIVGPDGRALAVERIRRSRASGPSGASDASGVSGSSGTGPPAAGRPGAGLSGAGVSGAGVPGAGLPGVGPSGAGVPGNGPPCSREPGPAPRAPGVTGRVTVTFPLSALEQPPPTTSGGTAPGCPGSGILTATWRAAVRAAAKAEATRIADTAAGGCAHTAAAPGYRPPPRIREHVAARDQTCRQPTCRQPAHHADIDHTVPYDQGGLTCTCNTGPRCRTHHQIKQEPGWTLTQPQPGTFHLTTPAGRTYATYPDEYPA
jgi:hypothetical protein